MRRHRLLEHPSDIAVAVEASSRGELFQGALEALMEVITAGDGLQVKDAGRAETFVVGAVGSEDESLLVDLLGELLFQCQDCGWYPLAVNRVVPEPEKVEAVIAGIPGAGGNGLAREVKAVTWHNLKVERSNGWRVELVFDV